jgi:hypothetical protein
MAPERVELGLTRLVEQGLLRPVPREDGEGYVPARPPERLRARDVLAVAAPAGAGPPTAEHILRRLREAQWEAAERLTFTGPAEEGEGEGR